MRFIGLATAAGLALTLCSAGFAQAPDFTHLPLGDGKISTGPQAGYVFACQTEFRTGRALHIGSWAHADGTFDLQNKPTVEGKVTWPNHSFAIQRDGATRKVVGNDLPDHPTGNFPIAASDPAVVYDRNPNAIEPQNLLFALPANPIAATHPSCVGMGPIGFLLTRAYLFNALDAAGKDAVAHEIQDLCHGHPERRGAYHYHNLTNCIADPGTGHSNLLGYALDGYGIFGMRGEDGNLLHNADLDACHGHTHAIAWDGRTEVLYHYHATAEYPYVVGCFHGTPVVRHPQGPPSGGSRDRRPSPPGGPPGE